MTEHRHGQVQPIARHVELPWDEGPLLEPAAVPPSTSASAPQRDTTEPSQDTTEPQPAEPEPQPAGAARPAPVPWFDAPLASLDLETTGRDPATDRILAIALFRQPHGEPPVGIVDTLVDPGPDVEIPDEAAAVHGITRERLLEEHAPPLEDVLLDVHDALCEMADEGVAVVIYNAPFDWPFLAAELARLDPPRQLPDCSLVDPLVLDRHVDRYRRGKRTLEAAAAVYGVVLDDAHEAAADALASLGVARAIGRSYPDIGRLTPAELHAVQVEAHGVWKDSFNAYLRRIGADREPVTGTWPDR